MGCDFSSRPTRTKPIVLAHGSLDGASVRFEGLQALTSLEDFARWLGLPGPWVGGFDLPFGLPRELVLTLGWPLQWEACMRHYASLSRPEIRDAFKAFCDARPPGAKFAHRAADLPAGASPSMKWVNPPVAYMLHAGLPLLLDAGVHLPGLQRPPTGPDARRRVGLESYPGLLAREVLGRRSYKSDDRARQTPERRQHRAELLAALCAGKTRLGLTLVLGGAQDAQRLTDDASGDSLDAVLCLLQAGWAARCGAPLFGLPEILDPLEGWIVTAGA